MQKRSRKQKNSITNTPRSHTGRNITTVFCITSIIIIIITIIRMCQTPASIQRVHRQPPTTHRHKVSQCSLDYFCDCQRDTSWLGFIFFLWRQCCTTVSSSSNPVIILIIVVVVINHTCLIFGDQRKIKTSAKTLFKNVFIFSFTTIEDVVSFVVCHQCDPMKIIASCTLQHRKPRVHHQAITQLICPLMATTGLITIAMTPAKIWPLVRATAWTLVRSSAQWVRTAAAVTPTWWPRPKWLPPQPPQRLQWPQRPQHTNR